MLYADSPIIDWFDIALLMVYKLYVEYGIVAYRIVQGKLNSLFKKGVIHDPREIPEFNMNCYRASLQKALWTIIAQK